MASTAGIKAGRAYVELGVSDKLTAGLRKAQQRLKAFGAGVRSIGANLTKFSAVFSAPFIMGTKVFADFEEQMANVSTMLDEPEKHMERFRQALRGMSAEFGESTEALAGGLYDILSASVSAEDALDVLTVAIKAAKAGLTDTQVAADAITTVLNSYGLAAEHAGDVSDLLFSIVKRGKTTFAQIAPSIGNVATIAASAGVSLEEMGAALAVMTRSGVQTENAVTALNAIISSFLRPTSDAIEYARELGLELSTATIRTEGLIGVFKRISNLPPDAIARLFPNVRALKGVLPAIKNMEGFAEDLQVMAARAGTTETAYIKMTGTLLHMFRQLRQSALVIFSEIGESMSEPLRVVGKAIAPVLKIFTEWVRENRRAVVSVAAAVVLIGSLGVALVSIGVTAQVLAFALGGLATVASAAGAVFGFLGGALATILSPIGLVVVAVAGMGSAILHHTGAAGAALEWLSGVFGRLSSFVGKVAGSMADALAAGNIQAAATVLWAGLRVAWETGIKPLRDMWNAFRFAIELTAIEAFAGVEKAWIRFAGWMWKNVPELTAFIATTWANMTTELQSDWAKFQNWLSDRWLEIMGWFDEDLDVKAAQQLGREDLEAELGDVETARKAAVTEAGRKAARLETERAAEKTEALGRVDAEREKAIAALEAGYGNRVRGAEDALQTAREALSQARERARQERAEVEAGPAPPGRPGLPGNIAEQIAVALDKAASRTSVTGAFNPAAIRGMTGAQSPAERTAKATELSAQRLKQLFDATITGGLIFA